METGLSHTAGIKELSVTARREVFKRLERTFETLILPKRDDKGRYYRGTNVMDKFEAQRLDAQDRIKYPQCGRYISLGDELVLINGYRIDGDLISGQLTQQAGNLEAMGLRAPAAYNRSLAHGHELAAR